MTTPSPILGMSADQLAVRARRLRGEMTALDEMTYRRLIGLGYEPLLAVRIAANVPDTLTRSREGRRGA